MQMHEGDKCYRISDTGTVEHSRAESRVQLGSLGAGVAGWRGCELGCRMFSFRR